jgi:hypothetical protein
MVSRETLIINFKNFKVVLKKVRFARSVSRETLSGFCHGIV